MIRRANSLLAPCACLASLALCAGGRGSIAPCEISKLLAVDGAANDRLGSAIALSGDTLAIGASDDDTPAGIDAGSVRIFARSGVSWLPVTTVVAADAAPGDLFGQALAMDGDTLIVGASRDGDASLSHAGAAYVFVRNASTWSQQAKLTPSDSQSFMEFGSTVSISGDTAVVGMFFDDDSAGGFAPSAAYVFVRTGRVWTQQARIVTADADPHDRFASAVDISGEALIIGSFQDDHAAGQDAGSTYIYARQAGQWSLQATLQASDAAFANGFGYSVAIDGNLALVGAWNDSHAGGASAGSAYMFARSGTTWQQQDKVVASDAGPSHHFGVEVAIHGETALVGAHMATHAGGVMAGAAYLFTSLAGDWIEQARLVASDATSFRYFGAEAALDDHWAMFGVAADHNSGGPQAGAAYAFSIGPDCNTNGIADGCDVHSGASPDVNADGVPDECAGPACLADTDGNDAVDVLDLLAVINTWGACAPPCPPYCAADIDDNCSVDVLDLLAVINAWGPCP